MEEEGTVLRIIVTKELPAKESALYGLLKSMTDKEISDTLQHMGNSYLKRFARLVHGHMYRRLP